VTATAPPPPTPSGTPALTGWQDRTDIATGPGARADHTWTVDGTGATAYLFGGRAAAGPSGELWAYDLATDSWTSLQPAGDVPAPRFGHTATWVPDVGLVIWSGQGDSGFFADIWAYDPTANSWSELPSLGAVPEARYGSCASLGPDGELWISHGFTEDSGRFADTRSYDFSTGAWTDRTPLDLTPVNRCLHDCFWSADDRLILYGGQTTGIAALGDVWAYDLWSGVWVRGPDPQAPPRQLYGLATDGPSAFVFGGGTLGGGFLADLWTIDAGTLELTPIEAGLAPTARSGATLIEDPERGRLVLFGGSTDDGLLGDLWELALGT
jgi:protein phosphatase